jgi:hypothetical protein
MEEETKMVLAALAGLTAPLITAATVMFVRRRRGTRAHARLYFSLRSSERTDTQHSNEPPPFPVRSDDDDCEDPKDTQP